MTAFKSVVIAAGFAVIGATGAEAATFDALGDFSTANTPGSVWAYGDGIVGSTFNALPIKQVLTLSTNWLSNDAANVPANLGVPAVIKNTSGNVFVAANIVYTLDTLIIHPGPRSDVIVQFTAPAAGNYSYSGLFEILDGDRPTGIVAKIFQNGLSVFEQALAGGLSNRANTSNKTPGTSLQFSNTIFLAAGDKLSFAANNGGNFTFDSTGFQVTITSDSVSAIPLPATWMLMFTGLAGVGLLGRGKSQRTV
ncbi:MAG: hypothetical protein U1E46_08900 [Hyphomicrobiales bacterium]